jgi:hypothetical protein
MHTLHQQLFPRYVPRVGDTVRIVAPEVAASPIITFVALTSGSSGKAKLNVWCMSGPGDKRGNIQLIWKPSTGWFGWILGQRIGQVRLGPA